MVIITQKLRGGRVNITLGRLSVLIKNNSIHQNFSEADLVCSAYIT
jgi:hypothetical protein